MSTQSAELWRRAYDALLPKDRDALPLSLIARPEDIVDQVEKYIKQSKGTSIKLPNGEKLFVRDVLQKVSRWIKKFVDVGDVAVQYDPGHAALPWALLRLVLQMSMNNVEKHAAILEGIEKVSYYLVWSKVAEACLAIPFEAHTHLEQEFVGLYTTILSFTARSLRFLQHKPHRILESFFSSGSKFDDGVKQMYIGKQTIESYTDQISNQTGQKQLALIHDVQAKLTDLNQPIRRIEQIAESTLASMERIEQQNMLDWVSTLPFQSHFRLAQGKALDGTGRWLFEDSEFIAWQHSSRSSMLWLRGSVGSGKSTLISMFIESLLKDHQSHQTPYPAYFYCLRDSAEPRRADPDHILRSLLRQTLGICGSPPSQNSLKKRFDNRGIEGELDAEETVDVIIDTITNCRLTYIIVDALDECDRQRRKILINSLKRILTKSASLVKIFVTSRDSQQDIFRAMSNHPAVCIEAKRNQQDIELYVKNSIENAISDGDLLGEEGVNSELRDQIETTLCAGADGMFRWVELQIQYLCTLSAPHIVRKRLTKLPPSLEGIYRDLYDYHTSKNDPYEVEIVKKLLSWLLIAKKRLRTWEMLALVYAPNEPDISNGTLVGMCFDLVRLDQDEDRFRFSHLSVREFLENRPDDFAQASLHSIATSACIDRVMRVPTINKKEYAVYHWIIHAAEAFEHGGGSMIEQHLDSFFRSQDSYSKWNAVVLGRFGKSGQYWQYIIYELSAVVSQAANALFAAAYLGSMENVRRIINRRRVFPDIDQMNVVGKTAITLASTKGHTEICELLIQAGAKITAGNELPLQAALRGGHVEVAKLLLHRGAEVNKAELWFGTPLQAACGANCDIQVVKLLLQLGADVQMYSESHGRFTTALHIASAYAPDVEVVKLLLDRGADVNAADSDHCTALQLALDRDRVEIAQLLLEHGANIHIGGPYGNVLQYASKCIVLSTGLLNLLLEHGANINAIRGYYGTALQAAASSRNTGNVKLLLEHGANINVIGGTYGTALQAAAFSRNLGNVKLLLEHGAEVNSLCGSFGSALQAAAQSGHVAGLKLLLRHGADVNAEGGKHSCALRAAVESGSIKSVKLLLKYGAKLDTVDKGYVDALEARKYFPRAPYIVGPMVQFLRDKVGLEENEGRAVH